MLVDSKRQCDAWANSSLEIIAPPKKSTAQKHCNLGRNNDDAAIEITEQQINLHLLV